MMVLDLNYRRAASAGVGAALYGSLQSKRRLSRILEAVDRKD